MKINPILEKRLTHFANRCCPRDGSALKLKPDGPWGGLEYFRCEHGWCEFEAISPAKSGAPLTPSAPWAYLLDPDYAQLPQQTLEQRRGVMAADVAALSLSRIAFVHRVETGIDIGTDFICELRQGDEPTGKFFNAQCKALPAASVGRTGDISVPIRASTARYWMIQPCAAILMVADPDTGSILWADAKAQLQHRTDNWRESGNVSLSVPRSSSFSCFSPPPPTISNLIHLALRQLGSTLQERLYSEEKMLLSLHRVGVDDSARDVSIRLNEQGSVNEVKELLDSLREFQEKFASLLTKRIAAYSCALRPRLEDEFRRNAANFGTKADYANEPDFQEFLLIIEKAEVACEQAKTATDDARLSQLVIQLKQMEFLHGQWLIYNELNNQEALSLEMRHDAKTEASNLANSAGP